jgi:hypothetical protein
MTSDQGPWAFVGDLHGRVEVLERILARDSSLRYHYVFVGDIIHHKPFFRFTKRTSPVKMLAKVCEMVDKGQATLILGNNENYILKSLVMPVEDIRKKEVKSTLKALREIDLQTRVKYISLLSNAPLSLELGGEFRLAHAYYPHATREVTRETVLHGPGYVWFRDNDLARHGIRDDYKYFFGHYGYPYRRKNVSIIDATSLEAVGVYYTDRDEFLVYY